MENPKPPLPALPALAACLVGLGALAGCGGKAPPATPAPAARAAEAPPKSPRFEVAIAREADASTLQAMRLSALDGRYEGTMLAAGAPKVEAQTNDEGLAIATVDVPIGASEPVRCSVSPGRADASRFFAHFLGLVAAEAPEVHVAAYASGPVIFARARYTATTKEGRAVGLLKMAVAPRGIGSIACVHDEVGYVRSFERVFTSAVEGRTSPSEAPGDTFVDVAKVSEASRPVGFVETRVRAGAAGGRESSESFVGLVKTDRGYAFLEGITITRLDKKGELSELRYVHLVNGAVLDVVRVERGASGYTYSGEHEGKTISGPVATKGPLTSWLGQLDAIRAFQRSDKKELRYTAIDDTEAPVASEIVLRKEGGKLVKHEGKHHAEITLDDKGVVARSVRGNLELVRLFSRGAP